MPRPLRHSDHRKFVETEGWIAKGTSRATGETGDHFRYLLKLATGEVLYTRVSHGSGAIHSADLVAHILREQLRVTEDDFYKCVEKGILPPRPTPSTPTPPPNALDGKLVRNLMRKVGMSQAEVAEMTKEAAVAAWQEYLASGGQ